MQSYNTMEVVSVTRPRPQYYPVQLPGGRTKLPDVTVVVPKKVALKTPKIQDVTVVVPKKVAMKEDFNKFSGSGVQQVRVLDGAVLTQTRTSDLPEYGGSGPLVDVYERRVVQSNGNGDDIVVRPVQEDRTWREKDDDCRCNAGICFWTLLVVAVLVGGVVAIILLTQNNDDEVVVNKRSVLGP